MTAAAAATVDRRQVASSVSPSTASSEVIWHACSLRVYSLSISGSAKQSVPPSCRYSFSLSVGVRAEGVVACNDHQLSEHRRINEESRSKKWALSDVPLLTISLSAATCLL